MNTTHVSHTPWTFGIPSLDDDRRKLRTSLNEHLDCEHEKKPRRNSFLGSFLRELLLYFEHEEHIMLEFGYPAAEEHRDHHRRFYARLAKLSETDLAATDLAQKCLVAFDKELVPPDVKFKQFWDERKKPRSLN